MLATIVKYVYNVYVIVCWSAINTHYNCGNYIIKNLQVNEMSQKYTSEYFEN